MVLFNRVFNLKVNEIKAKINLKYEEQQMFAQELQDILSKLTKAELIKIKETTKTKYAKTKNLLAKFKNISQKTAQSKNATTSFDAETFYDLSTKELACKDLISDCKNLESKFNKDLQF